VGLDERVRIATVNVNGIRAAFRRGMDTWLTECDPEALLLQEVRAPDELVAAHLPGWHVVHAEAEAKGRAGVAIATRNPPLDTRIGLGPVGQVGDRTDTHLGPHSGRWIEADLDGPEPTTLVSVYVHSGTVGHPSMEDKHDFLGRVTERMDELLASGRHVVVGGDLNITHTDADLKDCRGNVGKAGCLPEERAWLTKWFDAGWVDVTRAHVGEGPGPYTWWSWRGKAFDNDAGWRIDYQVVSPALAETARAVTVDRAPAYDQRFSDHAPLVVDYMP
jgi:exodeoxyribonuclease III